LKPAVLPALSRVSAVLICKALMGLLLMAVCSYGQAVTAALLGTVTDSTGGAVANARVTVTEADTGVVHASQTNDSGNYTFPALPPGRYSVSVEAQGFNKEMRTGVDVIVNTSTRADIELRPGDVTQSIEVTAATPSLQTDRSDTGRKMEAALVENMPLGVNRNFQNLLNLVPGATPASFQHSQFFNAASSVQTQVNGQPRQGNSYQIEGVDDNQRTGLLQILIPPAEAIQRVSSEQRPECPLVL
jgi:hypothetical protein